MSQASPKSSFPGQMMVTTRCHQVNQHQKDSNLKLLVCLCDRYGGVKPSNRKHHELNRQRRVGADRHPRH